MTNNIRKQIELGRHNFIESDHHGSNYDVIIYCTWCGVVVWDFNRSQTSLKELQENAEKSCKALADIRTRVGGSDNCGICGDGGHTAFSCPNPTNKKDSK